MNTAKAMTILVVMAVGLSGAAAVAADDRAPASTVALDVGDGVRAVGSGSGERINIQGNNTETISFARNEPFHLRHGMVCIPDEPLFDQCMGDGTNIQFFVVRRGATLGRLQSTLVEEVGEDGSVLRQWVVDFPDGWAAKGFHTFGAIWMFNKRVEMTAAVTVRFVDS